MRVYTGFQSPSRARVQRGLRLSEGSSMFRLTLRCTQAAARVAPFKLNLFLKERMAYIPSTNALFSPENNGWKADRGTEGLTEGTEGD